VGSFPLKLYFYDEFLTLKTAKTSFRICCVAWTKYQSSIVVKNSFIVTNSWQRCLPYKKPYGLLLSHNSFLHHDGKSEQFHSSILLHSNFMSIFSIAVFPKLCATAHWCAAEEAEVCRECFMFWQNRLYVTSPPLQSMWRVGFYKVGVPRPNLVFIIVCRN